MDDQNRTQTPSPKTQNPTPPTTRDIRTQAFVSRWQVRDKIGGRYEVQGIKKGGMGIVYLCYDHESQKPIVLKTFQDIFLSEKSQVEGG